ncbi:NAD(P)H-quinone oxidoreductase subunit M [Candidatus Cyanaurora vandensis]|uniref:NAD(P)H-quinone oxidoreductase subunit M n=1 Tax=Candidatus Cyanaurora vandensis TaxID=2714958 RepID=UPI002580D32C|nr:NAD(P)H-quinone oxidoreductase subunit M [Candidatus Cyanaurora vandensis]
MLMSTTRHIHIFAGEIVGEDRIVNDHVLTLDIDPDNEFVWNETALQKVRANFGTLVAQAQGEDLTEYNLRRIGSDLEHLIRTMIQAGEIAYNLEHRVINYSMGRPRIAPE